VKAFVLWLLLELGISAYRMDDDGRDDNNDDDGNHDVFL
jgi:hypothetical protein